MAVFRLRDAGGDNPTTTKGGFWHVKTSSFLTYATNWLSPGEYYYRAIGGLNSDGTPAKPAQIATAQAELAAMPQDFANGIESFHMASIIRQATPPLEDNWIIVCTFIPAIFSGTMKGFNLPHIKYLGDTWSVAEKNAPKPSSIWSDWWPLGKMDVVVFGWEWMAA